MSASSLAAHATASASSAAHEALSSASSVSVALRNFSRASFADAYHDVATTPRRIRLCLHPTLRRGPPPLRSPRSGCSLRRFLLRPFLSVMQRTPKLRTQLMQHPQSEFICRIASVMDVDEFALSLFYHGNQVSKSASSLASVASKSLVSAASVAQASASSASYHASKSVASELSRQGVAPSQLSKSAASAGSLAEASASSAASKASKSLASFTSSVVS